MKVKSPDLMITMKIQFQMISLALEIKAQIFSIANNLFKSIKQIFLKKMKNNWYSKKEKKNSIMK